MFVYLAGPLTAAHGFTVEENVAAAVKVYFSLIAMDVPCYCPHAHALFPGAWNGPNYEQWMEQGKAIIRRSTHVLMLPRWETSPGAVREKEYAESIGKIVLTDATALLAVRLQMGAAL